MWGLGSLKVKRRRQNAVIEREQRLEHAREAGRRLKMADVGLDRADRQRIGPLMAETAAQRGGFDRIAGRRASAMRFDEGEPIGIDAARE